jgi:hypothetical protein
MIHGLNLMWCFGLFFIGLRVALRAILVAAGHAPVEADPDEFEVEVLDSDPTLEARSPAADEEPEADGEPESEDEPEADGDPESEDEPDSDSGDPDSPASSKDGGRS